LSIIGAVVVLRKAFFEAKREAGAAEKPKPELPPQL